ncbi:MAG: beta-ketoacyl-[acyl-carrier-protein] synthase family protein [Sphaerobacteraceae bacterium]|nr:MAG: beta-ketoacyl-[acyl-carrier-protein] synthase family protein [Sphaerobacteraceae bacterium]
MSRRVVITGLGMITPLGTGPEESWAALQSLESRVRPVDFLDPAEFKARIAAAIPSFDPLDFMSVKRAKRLDRFSQLSVASSKLALEHAGIDPFSDHGMEIGVHLGSALGGVAYGEAQHNRYFNGGLKAVDPMIALAVFGGAGATNVAIEFGLHGPSMGNANSCASGANAIGEAFKMIRNGDIDVMLGGAVEAPLAPMIFGGFSLIRALSTNNDDPLHASRPFDAKRDGFVLAEAAAMVVLEEYEHAISRGATPLAEITGYAATNDAYNMIAPRPDAIQAGRALSLTMADAGIGPEDVDYINSHSTSTPLGDAAESLAIHNAFGERGETIPVSGTKGYYGHPLGASGAVEATLMCLTLQHQWIPPTLNLESADTTKPLNLITGKGMETRVDTILSNALGFGGINTGMIFKRIES